MPACTCYEIFLHDHIQWCPYTTEKARKDQIIIEWRKQHLATQPETSYYTFKSTLQIWATWGASYCWYFGSNLWTEPKWLHLNMLYILNK